MRRIGKCVLLLLLLWGCVKPVNADQRFRRTVLTIENLPEESGVMIRVTDLSDGSFEEREAEHGVNTLSTDCRRDYLVSLVSLPAGLMPSDEILLSASDPLKTEASIILQPFEVRIYQMIEGTDILTEGGTCQLINEEDEPVFEFETNREGRVFRKNEDDEETEEEMQFHAGDILIAHLSVLKEGYSSCGDQVIMIPEYQNSVEEPLVFNTYIHEADPDPDEEVQPPTERYTFYIPPVQAGYVYEEQMIPKTEEPVKTEAAAEKPAVKPAVYSYPVYQSRPRAESQTVSAKQEKAGFLIRLTDENRTVLRGCEIAVYDEEGNEIDRWTADGSDHLVQNEAVKAGRVYTIRQLNEIDGYTMSSVPIAHTAAEKKQGQYPVISIIDRRIVQEEEAQPQIKIRKVSGWLIGAAGASAFGALAVAAAVFMQKKHK